MSKTPNRPVDVFKYINTHGNNPDVCWEWTGSLGGRDQRPYFSVNKKKMLAYRIIHDLFSPDTPIQDGQVIRHQCNNPVCCNPKHIIAGSQSENEHDKYTSDRVGYTHNMLRAIRRFRKLGYTYERIAEEVNAECGCTISASGVGKVCRGERRTQSKG